MIRNNSSTYMQLKFSEWISKKGATSLSKRESNRWILIWCKGTKRQISSYINLKIFFHNMLSLSLGHYILAKFFPAYNTILEIYINYNIQAIILRKSIFSYIVQHLICEYSVALVAFNLLEVNIYFLIGNFHSYIENVWLIFRNSIS